MSKKGFDTKIFMGVGSAIKGTDEARTANKALLGDKIQ